MGRRRHSRPRNVRGERCCRHAYQRARTDSWRVVHEYDSESCHWRSNAGAFPMGRRQLEGPRHARRGLRVSKLGEQSRAGRGRSDLAGSSTRPFLSNPDRPIGIWTLGNGTAFWVSDAGRWSVKADLPGSGTQLHDSFYGSRKDDRSQNVDGDQCSRALSINSRVR